MVRPAALAEPDLERYTSRLPARASGDGNEVNRARHVKQFSLVVMDSVRSVSGHVALICFLAPARRVGRRNFTTSRPQNRA